jgi:hypothetical protein
MEEIDRVSLILLRIVDWIVFRAKYVRVMKRVYNKDAITIEAEPNDVS